MGGKRRAALLRGRDVAQPVGIKTQRSLRRDGRIELAHRTRGRIARIDKRLLAFVALLLVEGVKVVPAHEDFAAHFYQGRCFRREPERDLPDGAHVLGHVFPHFAVTTGGSLHQHAVLKAQAHGQAIELQFRDVLHGRIVFGQPQFTADAGIEGQSATGFGVGFGADAEHGHGMAHAAKSIQHPAANAPGR